MRATASGFGGESNKWIGLVISTQACSWQPVDRSASPSQVVVGQIVVLSGEAGVPVMPPLHDVQGHAGKLDAGAAWNEV